MTNTSADSTWIQTSYRHGVAWLQFDGSRAFDGTFWTELHNALRGVETSGTCAVALTSDAPAFSVGNSAAWLSYSVGAAARRGDSKTALYAVGDILRRTASEINQLPIPLIAVVSGETVGAGLELACLCDLRVCVDSVQISLPEAHLGVLPDIAPLEVLDEVLGARLSRRLLLTGQQEF